MIRVARTNLLNLPERLRPPAPGLGPPPEKDPEYLESLPPRFVIHTVHGTFAKRADWIEKDSGLCRTLRRQLGWRARIEPFRWSGANSIKQRTAAADDFRRHLFDKLDEFPQAQHMVIAHSHGGNVAFWAIKDEYLAKRILGVATLATPFLSAHAHSSDDELIDLGTWLFAGLFAGWTVLFYSVYQGRDFALWPWAVGVGLGLMGVMGLGGWLLQRMQQHAKRLAGCMPASALAPEQVAIVRVQGDEATAAITGVRLAGSMADLIWGIISAPLYKRINQLLKIMDYAGMQSFREEMESRADKYGALTESLRNKISSRLVTRGEQLDLFNPPPPPAPPRSSRSPYDMGILGEPWALPELEPFYKQPQKDALWASGVWQTLLTGAPALVIDYLREGTQGERLTAFVCLMLVSLPAIFAVATIVLGLPFGLISALSLVLIDWSAPLAGPYLRVMAEPSPAGTWSITQFEADRKPHGLFHSQAYQNPLAQRFIASWVLERA
jgi:hypothetical protein